MCKLAKEKGFPQEFDYSHFKSKLDYYNHKGELNGDVGDILKLRISHKPIPEEMKPISAPTQSLLQRWLREEKGYAISVTAYPTLASLNKVCYAWEIKSSSDGSFMKSMDSEYTFSTYELALEDALKYALENLVKI